MADIFSAIADATRRDILQLLLESTNGLLAVELAAEIGVTQPTVTKHVTMLADVGLIEVSQDAPPRFSLDIDPLEEVADWLLPFLDEDAAAHESQGALAVFSAWSGADAGATIGRVIADRSHRALSPTRPLGWATRRHEITPAPIVTNWHSSHTGNRSHGVSRSRQWLDCQTCGF